MAIGCSTSTLTTMVGTAKPMPARRRRVADRGVNPAASAGSARLPGGRVGVLIRSLHRTGRRRRKTMPLVSVNSRPNRRWQNHPGAQVLRRVLPAAGAQLGADAQPRHGSLVARRYHDRQPNGQSSLAFSMTWKVVMTWPAIVETRPLPRSAAKPLRCPEVTCNVVIITEVLNLFVGGKDRDGAVVASAPAKTHVNTSWWA